MFSEDEKGTTNFGKSYFWKERVPKKHKVSGTKINNNPKRRQIQKRLHKSKSSEY